jgi:hypothetical protein
MYRRDYMTAMLEGKTRHDPVLGMINIELNSSRTRW